MEPTLSQVKLIVACDPNGVIGKDNKLPWRIPGDLKHFKLVTSGNVVVMGRNTYESIGKPLPNRVNIVVSKRHYKKLSKVKGIVAVKSLEDAITVGKSFQTQIFIIGGSSIYNEAIEKKLIDKMIITHIFEEYEGDSYFKIPKDWLKSMTVAHDEDYEIAIWRKSNEHIQ